MVSTAELEMLIHAFISSHMMHYSPLLVHLPLIVCRQSSTLLQDYSLGQIDCLTLPIYSNLSTGLHIRFSSKFSLLFTGFCTVRLLYMCLIYYTFAHQLTVLGQIY